MYKVVVRFMFKVIWMLIIIVLGYMIFFGFCVVVVVLRFYGIFNGILFVVMFLFYVLVDFVSYLSLMGNFLIYLYYNGDFWKEIVWVCCRKKDKKIVLYVVIFVNCNINN